MKEPLKNAAWAGVLSIVFGVLITPLYFFVGTGVFLIWVSIIMGLVSVVLSLMFYKGYLVLGKKFDNTLLVVMTWIGIGLMILGFLVGFLFNVFGLVGMANAAELSEGDITNQNIGQEEALAIVLMIVIVWVLIAIPLGAYTILFGVAILKMQKDIKYARAAGIWNIVSGATYIILVGALIKIVAYIFEILMFFNASKKFERKRKI